MAKRNMLLNSNFEYQGNPLYNWQMDQYVNLQNNGGIGDSNCIRFDYHPGGQAHLLSQSMDLVPGEVYRMSAMAKRQGDMTLFLAVSYKNNANQWQQITSNAFNIPNGGAYQEIYTSFVIPSNVKSENVWMYVIACNTPGQTTAKAYVDNVQLYGSDGLGGNVYGRTRDWSAVCSSAGGAYLRSVWPNALVKILSYQIVGNERWVYFTRLEDGNGWIRATDIGLDPVPPYQAVPWVEATNIANVRDTKNSSTAQSLGKPSSGSLFQVRGRDTTYTEITWGKAGYPNGITSYILNSELSDNPPMADNFVERMCDVAKSFEGQEGAVAWQYAAGSTTGEAWCQSFLNNMAISAGLVSPGDKLMPTSQGTPSNTKQVMEWLRAQHRLSESSIKLVNGIPQSNQYPEPVEPPKLGDWVYFLSKKDAEAGYTTSHVEMVIEIDPNNAYRVKTCGGDVTVNAKRVVAVRWFDLKNMRPTGSYDYYYVAHGSPNW